MLSTTCIYDTSKRKGTKFGSRTEDEMCIDALFYYPLLKTNNSDSNFYTCSMFRLRRSNFNASICGNSLNFQQNPSFDDPVGLPSTFGDSCTAPAGVDMFDSEPSMSPQMNSPTQTPTTSSPRPNSTLETTSIVKPQANSAPACFDEDSTVQTRHAGVLRIRDLDVGDEVAVGNGKFSPVFMFTHREPHKLHEFVELKTAHGTLRLTGGHMLYVNGKLTRAAEVRIGDMLQYESTGWVSVEKVSIVRGRGLYNPQTMHGDILVDQVLVSTYTSAVAPSVAHSLSLPLRAIYGLMSWSFSVLEDDQYAAVRSFRNLI